MEGYDGVNHAISKFSFFRADKTKGKGKKSFVCAYGKKCLNRCPRLRERIECMKRRGLCHDKCGGLEDANVIQKTHVK